MPGELDYYAVLQISRTASQEDIERAYRRLSAQFDPATSRKPRAAQRHAEITAAYETLSDRDRRRQYDRDIVRRGGSPGTLLPSDVLSRWFIAISAVTIIASVAVILVAVLLLADGGDDDAVVSSVTPGTSPTPSGPTPTDAPAAPPEVSGETITTASGLQYIDVVAGTGASPAAADSVEVFYTGWLGADGTKFDSAVDRGAPSTFQVSGVVPGFREGLLGMKEGGQRRLIIPSALGYGETGSGSIPPNATLIFDVELVRVIPAAPTLAPTASP